MSRAQAALSGRHLVVTGFTGFLAKVFVAALLEHVPDIGRITLLVRPRGRLRRARVRVEQIVDTSPVFRALRASHGAGLGEWLAQRLDAVDGDVEQPACGLDDEALARLASADLVVHCAGLTDFEPDPAAALGTNVAGAIRAAELAERLRVPLVHVSTCYVAGALGQTVVPERLDPGVAPTGARFDVAAEIRALQLLCRSLPTATERIARGTDRARALGWPNLYTYTKGLAEHALARRQVDVTVVRPSIVECARRFPFAGWNEGLNTAGPLAWLISTAFRRLPTTPAHRFDVVPVDDVAFGMGAICGAALEGRAGGVFQLASSDHNPLTFDRAVELTGLGMRRWTRQGHGTPVERALFRWLDPMPVPNGAPGPWSFDRLRRGASWLRRTADAVDTDRAPEPLRDRLQALRRDLHGQLDQATGTMARIDKMLALYLPFIHDNDWEFRTDRARALTRDEPVFRFDLSDVDWCRYWVDVEYPGLRKWCIPLIEGQKVPDDPPSQPRFRLPEARWPEERRLVGK
ncbi:MAG: SDR family oxidoreductase [Bryobacterales bacterium]